MKLCTTIQSERGKTIQKTGNEFIYQEFTVNGHKVGQIELYLFDDKREGYETNEWLLKFSPNNDTDWDILAQGNI